MICLFMEGFLKKFCKEYAHAFNFESDLGKKCIHLSCARGY